MERFQNHQVQRPLQHLRLFAAHFALLWILQRSYHSSYAVSKGIVTKEDPGLIWADARSPAGVRSHRSLQTSILGHSSRPTPRLTVKARDSNNERGTTHRFFVP